MLPLFSSVDFTNNRNITMPIPNYDELFSDITEKELDELIEEPKPSTLATLIRVALIIIFLILI